MEGFTACFKDLKDPRTGNAGRHDLLEILMIALCTLLCGGESCVDMADFAVEREDGLRQFLCLKNGVPSHDTFSRLFRLLDPDAFRACFQTFVARLAEACEGVIAIDGKSMRRSFDKASGKSPLHMVTAWCAEQRLVLGQLATEAKSNEITAIPKLLAMLDLKDRTVTIDAMGCQRAIAQQIIDQGGNYVLALKGNQGTLHADVHLFLEDTETSVQATPGMVDGDHGRIETRTATLATDISWLQETHDWPGLTAVGKITRTREIKGEITTESVYYLLSSAMPVSGFADAARGHWGIENGLHWVLDVTMNEDQARNRRDNGPENLGILRHIAINLLSKEASKLSKRRKLNKAAWNNAYLLRLIAQI